MSEEGHFLSERIDAKPGDLIVFVWRWEIPLFNSPPVRAWGKLFGKGRDTRLAVISTDSDIKVLGRDGSSDHATIRSILPQGMIASEA